MDAHRFCVAPMLHCTDRHYRYLARLLSRYSYLYTEMITTGALIHGDSDRWLQLHPEENPIALQIGGSDPNKMAQCAELAEEYRFNEVNINVGCPSDRVQAGKFGACLMLEPETVAKCVKTMLQATNVEVTVKSRIGVDQYDNYEFLKSFVEQVASAGCNTFIIHARKAVLSGLTPRQNRSVPPLHYEYVYRLKQDYPSLKVIINGGIKTKRQITEHLEYIDGVMIGREAYDNPYMLSEVDEFIYEKNKKNHTRFEVLAQYKDYIQTQLKLDIPLKIPAQHIFGLFNGMPGARLWRRYLSENIYDKNAGIEVIEEAEKHITNSNITAIAS